MFFLKKNYGLFCILGPFFGGSPMLKTVKNGSGIRVDPPPPVFSKFPHVPVFFWQRPLALIIEAWHELLQVGKEESCQGCAHS